MSSAGATPPPTAFDWLIVTASNAAQAEGYRLQLEARRPRDGSGCALPGVRAVLVVSDPHGKRAGSGGSTFQSLWLLAQRLIPPSAASRTLLETLGNLRVLILHSGGDAQRLPEYSPSGKIFVPYRHDPLPAILPGTALPTTLFDCIVHDFVRSAPTAPGLTIAAGDLYLDLGGVPALRTLTPAGVTGISASAPPERGTRHGVYVTDAAGRVTTFLQKPTLAQLAQHAALRSDGTVAIDTGLLIADWNTITHWMERAGLAVTPSELVARDFLQEIVSARAGQVDLYEHILPLLAPAAVTRPIDPGLTTRLLSILAHTPFHALHIAQSKFLHIGTTSELLQVNLESPVAPSVCVQSWTARGPAFLENILAPDAVIQATGNNILIGMPADARAGRMLPADRCLAYFPIGPDQWTLMWHPLTLDFKSVPSDAAATLTALLCAPSTPPPLVQTLGIDPSKAPFFWPVWPVGNLQDIETAYHEVTSAGMCDTLARLPRLSVAQLHEHANLNRLLAQQQAAVATRTEAIPALTPLPRLPVPPPRAFSTITATSPARIDLAGGWTDTPPVCLMQGGHVVNMAVSLSGQHPIRVTVQRVPRPGLTISSLDQQNTRFFPPDQPLALPPAHDWCSLAQAAALLTICESAPSLALEHHLAPFVGLHIEFESRVPRGSGLGTSSILAGTLIAALRAAQGYAWTNAELHQVCTRVLRAEQLIGAGGGWQDQYGGLAPGIKELRTLPRDPHQAPALTPLQLGPRLRELFETRTVLYYTGQQRLAANILSRFVSRYLSADPAIRALCRKIDLGAGRVAQAVEADDGDCFVRSVTDYWMLKKQIDPSATNPALEEIIRTLTPHLQGHLLPGAGGGGFLLLFAPSTDHTRAIRAALASWPAGQMAVCADWNIDFRGIQFEVLSSSHPPRF